MKINDKTCNNDQVDNTNAFEVVIARYNENLSWIESNFPCDKVTVYNKGLDNLNLPSNCQVIKLPNIGRESHTYLHHIIENYNNLANRTLFLQGDPFDHKSFIYNPLSKYKTINTGHICKNIIAVCVYDNLYKMSNSLLNIKWNQTKWHDINISNETLLDFNKKIFGTKNISNDGKIGVVFGAQFAMDKEKITCNSISYHQEIYEIFNNQHPIEVHYIERLWDWWGECHNLYN